MRLTVDGIALNGYAWNIKDRGGRWSVPASPSTNVNVPGRHGALWIPGKSFEQNTITFSMWAIGCTVAGTFPTDRTRAQQVRDNLDRLTRIFGKRHALLEIIQQDDMGAQRRCYGEVTNSIDFSSAPGDRAEFAVEVNVPGAFWEDVSSATYQSAAGIVSGTNFGVTNLSGGSAPIEDAVITVRGAATNPKVTDILTGAWVQFGGTVASAQDWVVDNSAWSSANNATNVVANTTHSGTSARLLSLQPNPDTGDIIVKVEGTGFNANTRLTITGRRKWLIA